MNPHGFNAGMTRKSVDSRMLMAGIPEYEVYQRQARSPYFYAALSRPGFHEGREGGD